MSLDEGDEWSSDISTVSGLERLQRRDGFGRRRDQRDRVDQHPRIPLRDPARQLIEQIDPSGRAGG